MCLCVYLPRSACKLCAVLCLVAQLCLALCDPMNYKPARLLCPWGFSRQEHWSGLPCPPPWDLPNPGIEPSLLPLRQILCQWGVGLGSGEESHHADLNSNTSFKEDRDLSLTLSKDAILPYFSHHLTI